MSKLGPKCQYFVWPPLFSSTDLTLLGMEFTRASQFVTGVLLHDDITELVDARDLALLLPFEDAPEITFTLSFFTKAGVVLEVCLGSLCWNTALRPSLWREGIMLCFSVSQYILAFMVPSMNCSSPVPAALIQPQTMTLPPPCLTVGKTHLSLCSSPGCRHTSLTPSEPNKFILVSSDHRTCSSNPCP